MNQFINQIRIFFSGMIIGIANLIPGVSGGTMALILGFYERLIGALNGISVSTITSVFMLVTFSKKSREDFVKEMQKIDFIFLSVLFGGAVAAALLLAKLMLFLLIHFHDPTYGFFFGLVLPSIIVPLKIIKKISPGVIVSILIATTLIISTDFLVSDSQMIEKETKKYELKLADSKGTEAVKMSVEPIQAALLFLAGAAAVSAMILPGVSGSFILLLLGQYFIVLRAVTEMNISYILIFMAGIGIGLIIFTKFLHFLLNKYHDLTLGFLTGLVGGSLWIIWPFKNSAVIGSKEVIGYPETIYLSNMFPKNFTFNEIFVLITFILGIAAVLTMMFIETKSAEKDER